MIIAEAAVCCFDGEWSFVDELAAGTGAVASLGGCAVAPETFVRESGARGRHTVLAQPAPPGTRVLAERCVAAAVLESARGAVCDYCFGAVRARRRRRARVCGACGVCAYCSDACARAGAAATRACAARCACCARSARRARCVRPRL